MTPTPARSRRGPGRSLKSPLAVASGYSGSAPRGVAEASPALESLALTERQATIAEFEDYLRTTNNRDGRPYEDGSINAYVSPGKNLDAWLTANGIDGTSPSRTPPSSTGTSVSTTWGTGRAGRTRCSGT
jgi:hypothetical protein